MGYRLAVNCPDGRFLVEQQAYIEERDGQDRLDARSLLGAYLTPFRVSTTPKTSPSR